VYQASSRGAAVADSGLVDTVVGDFSLGRRYDQCRSCGGGSAPGDERPSSGAIGCTPALSRVAAVTDVSFEFVPSMGTIARASVVP